MLERFGPSVWAIHPERLEYLSELNAKMKGVSVDEALADRIEAAVQRRGAQPRGEVARIAINGVIQPKTDIWSLYGFATALDQVGLEFDSAIADSSVKGIVLDIDSPGGSVYGMTEFAKKVRAARGTKPILAVANAMAASGGYYIASQADEVWATPSGEVGSIGVVYIHFDQTGYLEQLGVKPTVFRSQPRKADVNPYETLSEEAAKDIQDKVAAYDRMFVSDVAKGRSVSPDVVRKNYGAGVMFLANDAKKNGLVDQVGTLEEAVSKVLGGRAVARQSTTVEDGPSEQVPAEAAPLTEEQRTARLGKLAEFALAGRGRR